MKRWLNTKEVMSNFMVNNIYVAIVGLNLNTTNQLKSLFQSAINTQFKIIWTNIANTQLDLVILNQNFIESPAASKIKTKNIPIITIQHDKNKENIIENNHLFLPFSDINNLKEWIKVNIKLKINTSFNPKEDINILEKFNIIFQSSHSNFFQCYINNEQSFIIDKKMHEIWVEDNFEFRPTNNLNIKPLDFNQAVNLRQRKKKYDLSLWLWNFFWSTTQSTPKLDESTYYKLKHWPQLSKNIPKETLKITSCLQHGANIQIIAKHLNIDRELVSKFICIAIACNLIEVIHEDKANFKLHSKENSDMTIMSFFSKIRKKLGI